MIFYASCRHIKDMTKNWLFFALNVMCLYKTIYSHKQEYFFLLLKNNKLQFFYKKNRLRKLCIILSKTQEGFKTWIRIHIFKNATEPYSHQLNMLVITLTMMVTEKACWSVDTIILVMMMTIRGGGGGVAIRRRSIDDLLVITDSFLACLSENNKYKC